MITPKSALYEATILLAEIMRDEVNAQDEAEKWLRCYAPHMLFQVEVQPLIQDQDYEPN